LCHRCSVIPCACCAAAVMLFMILLFAEPVDAQASCHSHTANPPTSEFAHSKMLLFVSVICCQFLRFLLFYMLLIIVVMHAAWLLLACCITANITSSTLLSCWISGSIIFQSLLARHILTAVGQQKNKWKLSSICYITNHTIKSSYISL